MSFLIWSHCLSNHSLHFFLVLPVNLLGDFCVKSVFFLLREVFPTEFRTLVNFVLMESMLSDGNELWKSSINVLISD